MKSLSVLLIFLVSSFCTFGQESNDSLHNPYSIEKIHLHFDKPYYAAGQTIWFKAYVVDGANQPSMLSKILYVDLINEDKQIKRSLKLPLSAGLGWGDIALPDTLSEGNYRIRGYTQWMRNLCRYHFVWRFWLHNGTCFRIQESQ